MPSTSAKQAKFMRAVSHSPSFAKKVGVSQKVGKDFEMADKKKKKFGDGGATMESKRKPIDVRRSILGSDKDIVDRGNRTPYEPTPKTGPSAPKRTLGRAGAMGYKCGGKTMKKYDDGGEAKGGKMKKYAKGGGVFRSAADGIAKKGKTKARMPQMAKGGKTKGCK